MGCVASWFSSKSHDDDVQVVDGDSSSLAQAIENEEVVKVIIVGDVATGKTSLLYRLKTGIFTPGIPPTIKFVFLLFFFPMFSCYHCCLS